MTKKAARVEREEYLKCCGHHETAHDKDGCHAITGGDVWRETIITKYCECKAAAYQLAKERE